VQIVLKRLDGAGFECLLAGKLGFLDANVGPRLRRAGESDAQPEQTKSAQKQRMNLAHNAPHTQNNPLKY
jgi:hypothetical protein